jgi:hypothetical protein
MNFMESEVTAVPYFLISNYQQASRNMENARNCEVGTIIAPFNLGPEITAFGLMAITNESLKPRSEIWYEDP